MVAHKNHIATDESLLALISIGNEPAFEQLYHRYASLLYKYAAARVTHPEDAEEIIQNLFLWLWEKRESLIHRLGTKQSTIDNGLKTIDHRPITLSVSDSYRIEVNVKAYLFGAVRHRVADHLAHRAVRNKHREHILLYENASDNNTEAALNVKDLEAIIEQRIAALPVNCQTAYRLSRQEQLSIAEVAARMKLSTGTVENYISQALKNLKQVFHKLP